MVMQQPFSPLACHHLLHVGSCLLGLEPRLVLTRKHVVPLRRIAAWLPLGEAYFLWWLDSDFIYLVVVFYPNWLLAWLSHPMMKQCPCILPKCQAGAADSAHCGTFVELLLQEKSGAIKGCVFVSNTWMSQGS